MKELKRFTEVTINEDGKVGLVETKEDEESYWIDVEDSIRLYNNKEFTLK